MFEDDIDIDEILETSDCTKSSLKRQSSGFHDENTNKKLRTDRNEINEGTSSVKKVFRFKKKETVPPVALSGVLKLDVNTEHSAKITNDCEPIEEPPLLPKNELNSSYTKNCDQIPRRNNETVNCSRKNVDEDVRECSESRIQSDRSIMKRRFPGPAGLLPERSLSNIVSESTIKCSRIERKDDVCSQDTFTPFSEEIWEKMVLDFKTDEFSLPEKYSIQWIRSRTLSKKLINQKAPFLAAFIDNIRSHSIQNPIVNLVLKDKTGTIQGTILHNLYEEHSGCLTIGSVIVLKDIGVLNTGPNEEPYLTITKNNLVSIYSNKKRTSDGSSQVDREILKTVLQNLPANEILNRIKETKRLQNMKLVNGCKTMQAISLKNSELRGPTNLSDSFRKVVQNVKSSSCSETPNLSVLRIKSIGSDKSIKSKENVSNCRSSKENENINELMNFFDSQEGIEEFFNEEPNYCSTQKENVNKCSKEVEVASCSSENQENSKIFEDVFDGVDASALFDEF
ncbi:uncharacterized protein LOC123320243 [Coccinella septempunctata]|uniref:uncharacterized protein LOC123320243 n=1 Tax=Coccinella septempunctata TaxID=41139 RepID=UPI001D0940EC|nr:uncharacterized protein LOC123320243 [Coccinella septempunctata]